MSHASFYGNLGSDPKVVTADNGNQRTVFSVAVTTGPKDNEKTNWVDVTAFGSLGENLAKSLTKGMRVFVQGRFDTYEQEVVIRGEEKKITRLRIVADQAGPDLRFASAQVSRNEYNGNGQGGGSYQGGGQGQRQPAPAGAGNGGGDDFF